jgi:hypothetical protein
MQDKSITKTLNIAIPAKNKVIEKSHQNPQPDGTSPIINNDANIKSR